MANIICCLYWIFQNNAQDTHETWICE